jgi:hypothetical protein
MIRENKLKFKFNPTPTLAKLYEQQGLYQDALRIYQYLDNLGKYDFANKILDLTAKLDPESSPEKDESSLTEIITSDDDKRIKDIYELNSPEEAEHVEISEEKRVVLPEYDYLLNIIFNDEEKSYFKIVPSDEFYFNKDAELVSIFTENDKGQSYDPLMDEIPVSKDKSYHEILKANEDINPEVTVADFVNILYTYYSKETKVSEIKIGDLFLLLSSIKLENS